MKRFKLIAIMFLTTVMLINHVDNVMKPDEFVESEPRQIEYSMMASEGPESPIDESKYIEPIIPSDPDEWTIPNDVYILAHVLNGEAGSNWCSDEMIYGVGSVVLNRVKDKRFPDTIEGVVFQKGQYACTWDGNYDREPSQRCWDIAWDLYKNGTTWPENVIFQAQFEQGTGVYKKIQNMYFCWKN